MKHIKNQYNYYAQKNVDKKEIEKFDISAIHWWNTDGIFKTLHCINAIRLDYILEHSNGLFGKTVLDIGCGGGLLAERMAREGAKVVGLDMSSTSLTIAKSHASSQDLLIDYILETVEDHAVKHIQHYDIVTCMELLEHVPHPLLTIHACSTIVKTGGSVFFSTLNRTFQSWLFIIIAAEYILQIIPRGTHKFKKFITPSELLSWIDTTNLQERDISGISYNPITGKCALTHKMCTNYILHTQHKI